MGMGFRGTPLTSDAMDGDVAAVRLDLKAGANPNDKNNNGETAMDVALDVWPENVGQIVGLLIDYGANANSPLAKVMIGGTDPTERLQVAKVAIAKGANVNQHYSNGTTPLSLAKIMNDVAMIKLLKHAGAKK